MKNILHSLYYGKIIPCERQNPNSEKQHTLLRKIESEERYFIEKMSPDDGKRFQELAKLQSERLSGDEENIFSYGFTLGLLMMMDITEQAKLIAGE